VALDRDDVHRLIECYGAAHGYLIHQFLSPATNQRSDEFWRPTLFLDLVLEAAPDLVVGIRVSGLEGIPGGLDAGRTLELVRSARLDLLDFIDVSAGNYQAGQWMVQPGGGGWECSRRTPLPTAT
jgi:2,4-dienoyl-CoA reductase-like NADH-dependent reductase (Old Yellow Enzyme family)